MQDDGGVPIIWRRHSFGAPIREARPVGMSVAEIVASVPNLPVRFVHDGVVLVGGQEVPREMWPHVRPKPAHCLEYVVDVELCLVPQGGNNRQFLATIASIALLVAATAVGGPLGVGFLTPLLGATAATVVAGAAGVGICCTGEMSVDALRGSPE